MNSVPHLALWDFREYAEFSDRPERYAHVEVDPVKVCSAVSEFSEDWSEGADSFAHDPPNALLRIRGKHSVAVEL